MIHFKKLQMVQLLKSLEMVGAEFIVHIMFLYDSQVKKIENKYGLSPKSSGIMRRVFTVQTRRSYFQKLVRVQEESQDLSGDKVYKAES